MAAATLNQVARELGVNPENLNALIAFESGWDPKAKNPRSSARGLLQFVDSTARNLGYRDSLDLVQKHPTAESQLLGPVRAYLKKFGPFPTKQSLYMAVFYPKARFWDPTKPFPKSVQNANPGIKTPLDYVKYVERKISTPAMIGGVGLGLILFAAIILMKGKKNGNSKNN